MKIIKYQKISKDKYKIFFDDDSSLALEEDVIIKNELLLKKEIDEKLYNKLIYDNKIANIINSCLRLIGVRTRSVKEIEDYLKKKEIDEKIVKLTLDKLINNGYLNDNLFTKCFIMDKINLTNYGPYKIINEIKKYGISDELIDKYLDDKNVNNLFKEKINKLISKSIKNNKKYSGNMLKNKINYNLISLGYDKNMIIEELNNYVFKNNDILKNYQKLYNKYKSKYDGEKLNYIIINKLLAKGYTYDDINNVKNM